MQTRTEKDTLGEIAIPADRYWGAQTQRSLQNFRAGNQRMPIEVIHAYAVIKQAAAYANAGLGVLSHEKAKLVAAVCEEIRAGSLDEHFPLVVWQTGSGTQTNMNVNEVIANRALEINGGVLGQDKAVLSANDEVNRSQSSNDTFPTAMHIAAYDMLTGSTLPALTGLAESLQEKSRAFDAIVKIGRTHLMDATPLTLGQEFSGYTSQLQAAVARLDYSVAELLELPLGGTAVGTGLNAPEGFAGHAIAGIAELTGHPFRVSENRFAGMAAHDAIVACHAALKGVAVSLMKIASDIRLLGSGPRAGIGELVLPANEPGSSIMPGKVNPTQCEALTMICAQVMGNDVAVTIAGMSGQFELNVFKPQLIQNLLHSARLLADGAEAFDALCVKGLEPASEGISRHLENSLMLVTALNPHIGYYKAAEIAQLAHGKGLTLKVAALELGYVTEEEFDAWVDPAAMTGRDKKQ